MRVTKLSAKKVTVNKGAHILDWQDSITESEVSVKENQTCNYFLVQGLSTASKHDVTLRLKRGSTINLYGIVIGTRSRKHETNIEIIHEEPETTSYTHLRGIFTDRSSGKLTATIIIRPDGQLSDAKLEERVLLLSDNATAQTIPNLEILADDVKATHAATVSKIMDEDLFYLQSRGLSHEDSRRLIVTGFIRALTDSLPDEKVRDKLYAVLIKKLST